MIGDWVMIENYSKICAIAEDGVYFEDKDGRGATSFDRISPIPLTAEILEKNGFEHKHDKEPIKRQYWIINVGGGSTKVKVNRGAFLFNITGLPFREGYYNPSFNAHIQYVHELQHALRLCGIDKEIVL